MKVIHLFPTLATENLSQTILFYTEFLGFECHGQYPQENPCWASLCKGEAEIAFNVPNGEFEKTLLTGSIYLNNIAEVWDNLKDKVEIVYPMKDFD